MAKPVQHYRYNSDDYEVVKNVEAYFVENFNPASNPDDCHWLNFHSMKEKEAVLAFCDRMGFDKMVQEDLYIHTKRPHVEEYDNYVFFSIISALPMDEKTSNSALLKKEQISFILGKNYLISFQEKKSDHFPSVRDRLEHKRGKIRASGPDFLLFRMLEAIIDNYLEVMDEISENVQILDKLVIRNPKNDVLRRVEFQKRKLVDLRKTVQPMRELLTRLERLENHIFNKMNCHYFEELKDTCLSCLEEIDAQKQILEGIANLYYADQGQRMNEIMKVLTVISAIFIPLTFIAGIYGMNFDNIPELHMKNGYFYVWGLMLVIAATLMYVFVKRGWIQRKK